MTLGTLLTGFLQDIGIIALAALSFAGCLRRLPPAPLRDMAAGAIFAGGAVASMALPTMLSPGVIFDLRHVFLVLAASYGGWRAALIAGLAAGAFRLHVGGIGMIAGLAGIATTAVSGCLLARFYRRADRRPAATLAFGLAASLSIASLLLLPWPMAFVALERVAGPIIVAHLLGVFVAVQILDLQKESVAREHALVERASTDPLTGLMNRRVFDSQAPETIRRTLEAGRPCALALVDIDHFKAINDAYGHPAGDAVLQAVSQAVASKARQTDLVARIGGEEFALVLPGMDLRHAQVLAGRIRQAVEGCRPEIAGRRGPAVTASIGVHAVTSPKESFASAFERADHALYAAKAAGRNRVRLAEAA